MTRELEHYLRMGLPHNSPVPPPHSSPNLAYEHFTLLLIAARWEDGPGNASRTALTMDGISSWLRGIVPSSSWREVLVPLVVTERVCRWRSPWFFSS